MEMVSISRHLADSVLPANHLSVIYALSLASSLSLPLSILEP